MAVRLRLSGDPGEILQLLTTIGQVVDLAAAGRTYPDRSGFGVRVYTEARLPTSSERHP